jgi:N-hydroxyarylamine O-acetyltransferase
VNLQSYLERIGFQGEPAVNEETLFELHRLHVMAIPYENLDVQLKRLVDLDIERIYDKIVGGRGGWCYEMNGIFSWALSTIGFDVTRMGGAVAREFNQRDDFFGAHLILNVTLDDTEWLCDVGFGDGFPEPIRLEVGPFEQRGFHFEVVRDGKYWRVRNHQNGGAPSYDFEHTEVDQQVLQTTCDWLRSDSTSPFTRWLIAQRFVDDGYQIQTGLTAKHVTPGGITEWTIDSLDALLERLVDVFDLDVPEVAGLWPELQRRHEASLDG